jgi:hypothetical protein
VDVDRPHREVVGVSLQKAGQGAEHGQRHGPYIVCSEDTRYAQIW